MSNVDLDLLVHRYFEQTISDADEKALFDLIRSNPAAADRFVELCELEGGLVELCKAAAELPSAVRRAAVAAPGSRRSYWPAAAVAAGLLLAVAGLLLLPSRPPSPDLTSRTSSSPAVKPEPQPLRPALPVPVRLGERSRDVLPSPEGVQRPAPEAAPKPLPPLLPEEKSEKPAPKPSTAGETRIAVGILERVEGEVLLRGEPGAPKLEVGRAFPDGGAVETRGSASSLLLKLEDGTRLELKGDALLEKVEAKRIVLGRGFLTATVAKQPARTSFVVVTPQTEVTVIGTRFTLNVGTDQTRVEVEEGRVRCRRTSDGASVEIGPSHAALLGRAGPLAAKPVTRVLAFQDGLFPTPGYAGTQDTSVSQTAPTTNAGTMELLRVHRNTDNNSAAFIRWDVTAIPPGSRILSADLTFWITGSLVGPGYRVYDVRRNWGELEATWKLLGDGDRSSKPIAALTPSVNGLVTVPLNESGVTLVQSWINDKNSNFGIQVAGAASAAAWDLDSRESATPERRPKLTVTFVPSAK